MIQRIVALALKAQWIVILLAVGLVAGGLVSYAHLDIEAYPNPVPPLVEVIAQPTGWSGEEVERYVTIPLEVALSGIPGLDHIRSQSVFGLSDVKCYFSWGTDYTAARQEVINRIQLVTLPNGIQAQISPWNAIGEVFRYTLRGNGYSLQDLKTAQDWVLERQFKQVPGVIDVVSFGGLTKQYQVNVDPFRLRGMGVTLAQLESALAASNVNVGGQQLFVGEQAYNVRGIGLIKSTADIEEIVIDEKNGTPVRVRDVARVQIGNAPRLGKVGHDDNDDVVEAIVLMRYGGETAPTLKGVHKKLQEIKDDNLLPPGMEIVPYYDRGTLVELTTHTVTENIVVGMLLVSAILFLFLGHARAALITAINIPLALLIAFSGMIVSNTPANLISLGAVDFGIVVDSTIIMMENIFRRLGKGGQGTITDRVYAAAGEVGGPMLFSTLIIGVAFLPLFTISGVSGVIFSPLAHTYAFSIGGALVLAVTLTPVLAAKFLPAEAEEKESLVMRALERAFRPLADRAMRWPRVAVAVVALLMATGAGLLPLLGGEFMPKLEEGNFWIRATLPTSVSFDEAARAVTRMRRIVRGCPEDPSAVCDGAQRKYPEIQTVVSQMGRPDDGTDVTGFSNIEMFVPLEAADRWPKGVTKDSLREAIQRDLDAAFVGTEFNFSQAISDNVEEALSGVKGENSIKVVGPDIRQNEAKANAIADTISSVRGITEVGMLPSMGMPSVNIVVDRLACSRYGIHTGDVEDVIEAAVAGKAVTGVYEGEKVFDLTVRWLPQYRETVDAIRSITVTSSDGAQIPLAELAKIDVTDGPAIIFREDGHRYSPVKFSVRNRDLASAVNEAKSAIARNVKRPYEMHLIWGGQMNELEEALGHLGVIIPVTLLLIGLLVYASVRNWLDTVIVLLSIPVASTGGVIALLATGTTFSISAAMGFISIFGIAIQDAILVVTYYQRFRREGGLSVADAAHAAAEKGFRPALMTTLVAMLGLFPAAVSTGIGSQTQKALALVVIGGSAMLALTSRVTRPPMLVLAHKWLDRRRGKAPPSAS